MASNKNAMAMCDTCGFVYPHRIMRFNSYGMLVCPTDFEGQFDLKNHPQNKIPDVRDNPAIRDPRRTCQETSLCEPRRPTQT